MPRLSHWKNTTATDLNTEIGFPTGTEATDTPSAKSGTEATDAANGNSVLLKYRSLQHNRMGRPLVDTKFHAV